MDLVMVADVEIVVFHGGSDGSPATQTFITDTHIRFKRADNDTFDTANPVPRPTSGRNYSYSKSMKIKVGPTAPANEISNVQWFSDGQAIGSGVELLVTKNTTYFLADSADESTAIVGTVPTTSSIYYVSGSPLVINSGVVHTTVISDGFGTQDYVVQQMAVSPSAGSGHTPPRTCFFRYDEA